MAFHAGADWRQDTDKIDILALILQRRIPLRILVNSVDAVEAVCSHMRQPLRRYVKFGDSVREWAAFAKEYPDLVQVRVLDVPLLHCLYLARCANGTGTVNVKYYTYGNFRPAKDCCQSFSEKDAELLLYTEEFDYLWKIARETD